MKKLLIICFLIVLFGIVYITEGKDTEGHIMSPKTIAAGEQFTVFILINNVTNLSACDYTISYNASICHVETVNSIGTNTSNLITNYTVDYGVCKIVQYTEDGNGLSGSVYLSKIIFNCISNGHTTLSLAGNLSSTKGTEISSDWKNTHVNATFTNLFFDTPELINGVFFANLTITNVYELSSYNAEIIYDETKIELIEIGNGYIADKAVIINYTQNEGEIKIVGMTNTSGNGTLAKLLFSPINAGKTTLNITNKSISNSNAEKIITFIQNKSMILQTNPPSADFEFSPVSPTTESIIRFDSSLSSDEDGIITNYSWTMGDGTFKFGKIINYSYSNNGRYLVNLTITDNEGNRDSASYEIIVLNIAPIASFNVTPPNPDTETLIQFADLSSDTDGIIINWTWNFGDDIKSYLQNPQYQYDTPGQYSINLSVTDNDNTTSSTIKTINVQESNQPPLPPILISPLNGQEEQLLSVTLSLQVIDPDNDRLNVSFFEANSDTQIKSLTYIESGDIVSINWNNLEYNTQYFWYVKIRDNVYTIDSEIWSFKTKKDTSIKYSLSVGISPSIGGSVSPASGQYDPGQSITLTATSNNGYEFDRWSGDASGYGSSPVISIIINKNFNVIAVFRLSDVNPPPDEYILTTFVEPGNGGYLILDPSGSIYQESTLVTITAFSYEGFQFDHWGGALSGNKTIETILINSDETVEAYFIKTDQENEIPFVNITEPINNSKASGKISIFGSASDSDGLIQKVEIRIDSNQWSIATGTISWDYQINTENLENGIHKIYVRSYDGYDYSNTRTITIDVSNDIAGENSEYNITIIAGIIVLIGTIVVIALYMLRKRG